MPSKPFNGARATLRWSRGSCPSADRRGPRPTTSSSWRASKRPSRLTRPSKEDGYTEPPTTGLRAFARVYAGWALSQAFYREHVYLEQGYSSPEDYLIAFWEGNYVGKDANDLLAMLWTWQNADIGATSGFEGDLDAALGAIEAKAIVMPGQTDLYFPPEDDEYEVSRMLNAEFRPIPSIWGHFAGSGRNSEDVRFIDDALRELLAA